MPHQVEYLLLGEINALLNFWGLAIMFRFIALGTHNFESYILAGFGIAFLSIMRFFVFKMR